MLSIIIPHDQILIGPSFFHKTNVVAALTHQLYAIFTQLIGKRDQNQSNVFLQIDYDNRGALLITITSLTCAKGRRVYKSEIATSRVLSLGSLLFPSMSRRKQPHPKHIENEQQVASFLENNGTSAVSPKRGYGDAHVCGKCRAEFVDLAEFLSHKKCCTEQMIVCSEEGQEDKDCEDGSPDRELQEGELLTETTTTTTNLSATETATTDTADVNIDPTTLELLKQERKDDVENELGSLNEDADDIDDEVDDIEDDDDDFDDGSKLSTLGHQFLEEQTHHTNPHLQHLYAISTSTTSKLGIAETTTTSNTSLPSDTMRMSPEQCSTDKHSPIMNGADKDTTASAYDLNGADFPHLDDGRKLTPESPSSQLPHFPVPYSSMNGTGGNVIIEPLSETRAAVAQFAEGNSINPSDMASLRASIFGLQQQATAFIQCVNMFEERFMSFASSFGEGAAAAAAGLHLPNGPASAGATPTGLPAIAGSGLHAAGQSPLDGSAGSMDLVTSTVNSALRQAAIISKAGIPAISSHSAVPTSYQQTIISSTGQHHPHSQSHNTNQLHSNLTSLTSSHSSTMDYHPYQGLVHHPSFGHAHGFRHKCKYCQKVFSNELSLQVHMRSHTGERPYRCNVCNIKFTCKSALRVHFAKHKSHLQLPQQPLPAHSAAARNAALLSSRFPFQPMSLAMSSVAVSLPAAGVPITATASPTLSPAVSRAPLQDAASASISQSLIQEGESPSLKLEKPEPKLGEGATDTDSLNATANNNGLTNSSTPGHSGSETPTSSIGLTNAVHTSSPRTDPSPTSSVNAAYVAALTASNSSFAAAACSPAITTTSSASHIPLSATRHFPLLPPLTVVPHPQLAPLPPHFNTSGHGPPHPPPPPPPPPLNKPDLRSMPGGLFPPAKHIEPGENVEDYMEVNTSETSKLQKFVENIEHKLSDPNECAICHRVLSCKSALQMHYRIHTGERPFRCKLCGRAFTTKGNLKTHMGVHRAKPPTRLTHQCPVCHKQFTNILVLQQHIRGHTSDTYPSMPPSLYRASEWHPKPFDLRPHLEPRELDLSKTAPSFSHHPALPSTTSPSLSLNSASPAISPMDNSIKISPGSLDMTQKVLDATGSIDGSTDRHLLDEENSIIDDSGVMDGGHMMDDEGLIDDGVIDSDAGDDGVMDTSVMDDSNMMDGSLADSNLMDTDDLDGEKLSVKERKIDGDENKVDDWIESKRPTASTTPTSTTATSLAATITTKKEEDWGADDSQASSDAAHEDDRPNSMASIGSHESPEFHKIHGMNPMSSYESHINSVITSGFVPPSSTSLAALEARVRAINSNNPLSMTVSPKFDLRLHPRDMNPAHKQFSPHLPNSAFLNGDSSSGTSSHPLDALSDSNGLRDAASMHVRPDVPGFPMSSVFPLAPALDLRPRNVEGKANTTCYICFKTFACKSALDIHIRSHTKERPFKCEVCDRSFSTKGNMRQHMLTHKIRDLPTQFKSRNGSNSSDSPSNPAAPSNSANLGTISGSETPVKIEQVSGDSETSRVIPSLGTPNLSGSGNGNGNNTSIGSSSNLNSSSKPPGNGEASEHTITPTTPLSQTPQPQISPNSDGNSTSPFVRRSSPKHTCSVCQKQFSSASALQIHIRTHTGDRPFKCNMCAKAFTTKGNLKVHMGTHMWGNNPSRRGRRMSIEPPFLIGPKEQHYLSPYHRSPDFLFHQYPHFLNGLSPKMNEISVIQSLNGSMNHLQNHLSEVSKEEPPRSDSVGGRSSIESDRKSTESLPSSWPSETLAGLNLAHHHQQQAQAALLLSQHHQQMQQQQSPNGSSHSSHSSHSSGNNNSIAAQNLEGGGLIASGLGLGGVAQSSHDLLLASGLSGELDLSMKSTAATSISSVVSGPGTGVNTAVGANVGPAGAGGSVPVSGGGSSAVSTADSTASSPPAAPPSVSPPPALASTPNSDRDLGRPGTPTTPTSTSDTHQSVGAWSWRTICPVCQQVFPTSSSLDHHLRTHHHGNPTEEPLRTSVSN